MTRNVGLGQEAGKENNAQFGMSVRFLRGHYGVHFPKERCLITNRKYKPGLQDKGGPLECKLHMGESF